MGIRLVMNFRGQRWGTPRLIGVCRRARWQIEVLPFDLAMVSPAFTREALRNRVNVGLVPKQNGPANGIREVKGKQLRALRPDGKSINSRIRLDEPAMVVVDPNTDRGK